MTLLATSAASASSFVTPEPMTAKLGPSMIMLGEPESAPAAIVRHPAPADGLAGAIVQTPLNYPVPIARNDAKDGGTPASKADFIRISPSIIAMAAPEPAVSFEKVAALDEEAGGHEAADRATDGAEARRRDPFGTGPTVIRGGVIGNAQAAPASVPSAEANEPEVARAPYQPSPSQAPGEPDHTPPSPPAGIIPQTRIQ